MDNDILVDSYFINNGGGKVLLDYLLLQLEKNGIIPFLLLDARVQDNLPIDISKFSHKFVNTFSERNRFYKDKSFKKILCFGNIPVPRKAKGEVFTYFHQPLFLEIPENFSFKDKLIYSLKIIVLKRFKKNTKFWLVQSIQIKEKLLKKYQISPDKIMVLPFYPPIAHIIDKKIEKSKNSYIYISNAPPHKNHVRLINAFCDFFDKNKLGKLTLTISENFVELIDLINEKQKAGYPILNIGFVRREKLLELYQESEYVVFPSLAESFGLGLIEGIEAGCKIIGADLAYTYAVCEPSLVFNPLDENSISNAFTLSLQNNISSSLPKVTNEIDKLILLLNHENTK
nr:glycosyltransferase [uncultured Chryseobacterium sp.]